MFEEAISLNNDMDPSDFGDVFRYDGAVEWPPTGSLFLDDASFHTSVFEKSASSVATAAGMQPLEVLPEPALEPSKETHEPLLPTDDEWAVTPISASLCGIEPADIGFQMKTRRETAWRELSVRMYWTSTYMMRLSVDASRFPPDRAATVCVELLNATTMNVVSDGFRPASKTVSRLESEKTRFEVTAALSLKFNTHSHRANCDFRFRFVFGNAFEVVSPSFKVLARRPDGEEYIPREVRKRPREDDGDDSTSEEGDSQSLRERFFFNQRSLSTSERVMVVREFMTTLAALWPGEATSVLQSVAASASGGGLS